MAVINAAHALRSNGQLAREEIVPTLAFAALSQEVSKLDTVREGLIEAARSDGRWEDVQLRFSNTFEPLELKRYDEENESLIISRSAIRVTLRCNPGSKVTESIEIEVANNESVSPEALCRRYQSALDLYGIDYYGSPGGGFDWGAYKGKLRIVVRPEGQTADSFHHLPTRPPNEQPPFPAPELVGEFFRVLRGSTGEGKFRGFGPAVLPGRPQGEKVHGDTLIGTCVAWYLTDRGQTAGAQRKRDVTSLLAKEGLWDHEKHQQLWDNVRKREEAIRREEHHISAALQRPIDPRHSNKYL